jgi:NTP pyrophosphatase (non-canonical NTP hydrolase)
MDFNEYQKLSFTTAQYPEHGTGSILALCYTGLGLGEVGEVQGKIKKILRDDNFKTTDEKRAAIKKELGDCLWYIAALATELSLSLNDIAEQNVEKLLDRKERGVIVGSGDDR